VADGEIDEAGLFFGRNDVDGEAKGVAYRLNEVAAVAGLADGAGGDGAEAVDTFEGGHLGEPREGREAVVHGTLGEKVAGEAAFAEADHVLVAAEDVEVALGRDFDHDEVDGISADVDGAELGGRGLALNAGAKALEVIDADGARVLHNGDVFG